MTVTEILQYFVLPLSIVIIAIAVYYFIRKNKKKSVLIPTNDIKELFDKQNINSIDFIRNKIVVSCVDYKQFDVEKLKELGATGINIVGNKIKFYYIDNDLTKALYEELATYLER